MHTGISKKEKEKEKRKKERKKRKKYINTMVDILVRDLARNNEPEAERKGLLRWYGSFFRSRFQKSKSKK